MSDQLQIARQSPELEPDQAPLQRYFAAVRQRWRLIALATLCALAAAVAYLLTAPKVYEAEAMVHVTPVARDDPAYTRLGLIRETSDPTRDVETASLLIHNVHVARRVNERLGLQSSADDTLEAVAVEPIAQSNLVSVIAAGSTPALAADLANAFALAGIERRTEALRGQLDETIERVRERIAATPAAESETQESLEADLARLEELRGAADPTLRLELPAVAPTEAVSPRPAIALFAGGLAGLILGLGAALTLAGVDPRLRRDEQLFDLARWPILARIPAGGSIRQVDRPLSPMALPRPAREGYRTLAARLLQLHRVQEAGSRPLAVLVTSATGREGKSTTAINLAHAFASPERRVLLIEWDLRLPKIGAALNLYAEEGVGAVLAGRRMIHECAVPVPSAAGELNVLLAGQESADVPRPDALAVSEARQLLTEAQMFADVVVIDSPPLTMVADALPFTQVVTQIVLAARVGHSRLPRLTRLRDMLYEHGVVPTGWVVVNTSESGEDDYYGPVASENNTLSSGR